MDKLLDGQCWGNAWWRRQGLEYTPIFYRFHLPWGATSNYRVLPIWIVVWKSSAGTPKLIEGDLGGQWIYKRLKCGIIHSVSAGEVGEHDRVCEKKFCQGKGSAEELVRSECKAQGVLPRRPSISAVTYLNSKLLAQWQGPYPVIRHVGSVNNQIDMVGKKKRKRIFHVNMLQKWNSPTSIAFWAKEEESPEAVHD